MAIRWQDYIEERKQVMLGKPVFKGTRLTVQHVLNELGSGMSEAEILAGYPQLTANHIRAACLFASAMIAMNETIYA